MSYAEQAARYGMSIEEYRDKRMAFLQTEGYHDDGHESETLDEYLTYRPQPIARDPVDAFDAEAPSYTTTYPDPFADIFKEEEHQ